jgi:hypothetical protein
MPCHFRNWWYPIKKNWRIDYEMSVRASYSCSSALHSLMIKVVNAINLWFVLAEYFAQCIEHKRCEIHFYGNFKNSHNWPHSHRLQVCLYFVSKGKCGIHNISALSEESCWHIVFILSVSPSTKFQSCRPTGGKNPKVHLGAITTW